MEKTKTPIFMKGIVTLRIGEEEYKYDLSKELEDQHNYMGKKRTIEGIIDELPEDSQLKSYCEKKKEIKQIHSNNMKKKLLCVCGQPISKGNLITHLKTKKHAKLMNLKH